MTGPPLVLWKRLFFGTILTVALPLATIGLIEGCSSLVLWQRDQWHGGLPAPEPRHKARYDTLLGWVNPPNFYDPDLFAPGVHLRTNAQGFRDDHLIAPRVPPGRIRAVCSGDSFTFGFGIDNDHTWCALLERKISGLETVNMGVSGYGVDQAYLWYKRDAQRLDHDLHIFALIFADFYRMSVREFAGAGKPVLRLDGDTLRVQNVPVPTWYHRMPGLASFLFKARRTTTELRTVALLGRVRERLTGDPSSFNEDPVLRQVAERVLVDLTKLNRAKKSQLVVVVLPTRRDWRDTTWEGWRDMLTAAAARNNFLLVDLQDEFRRLRRDSLTLLFSAPHDVGGHYAEAGHEWVADRLHRHLSASPQTAPLLKQRDRRHLAAPTSLPRPAPAGE